MTWAMIIIQIAFGPTGPTAHIERHEFKGMTACQQALDGSAFAAGPGVSIIAFCAQEIAA